MLFWLLQQHNLVPATPLVSAQVLREDAECWMDIQVVNYLTAHNYSFTTRELKLGQRLFAITASLLQQHIGLLFSFSPTRFIEETSHSLTVIASSMVQCYF